MFNIDLFKSSAFNNKLISTYLIIFFCTIFSHSVTAKIYKHVDENGKVTYSDKPIDKNSKPMQIKQNINQQEQKNAQQRAQNMIQKKNRLRENMHEDKVDERKKKNAQAKQEQNCKQAKKGLQRLQEKVRLVWIKDGKRTNQFMTDKEREKEIAEHKKYIEENCND